jgi:ribonuclease HII
MSLLLAELIAGVDEAGRGPLAGPVIAAAVILDPNKTIHGLTDSKLLNEKQREALYTEIIEKAYAYGIGRAEVAEIDEINILQASMLAMERAVAKLGVMPHLALIDGNRCPNLPCAAKAIIKGDLTEPAISAASILAKVTRDREMHVMHAQYPEYDFAKHKGYPTKSHMAALEAQGPCVIHRRTYAPVAKYFLLDESRKKLVVEES